MSKETYNSIHSNTGAMNQNSMNLPHFRVKTEEELCLRFPEIRKQIKQENLDDEEMSRSADKASIESFVYTDDIFLPPEVSIEHSYRSGGHHPHSKSRQTSNHNNYTARW